MQDAQGQGWSGSSGSGAAWRGCRPFLWFGLLALGLFWSTRGYESLDGDQAYRLPLLIDRMEPGTYRLDPFVRAFDAFNPHRGALAVQEVFCRALGLSGGLLVLFLLNFAGLLGALWRIVRRVAGGEAAWGAWVAVVVLFLGARAGNIGTNHLVDSMLLDRQIALVAGWWAVAFWLEPGVGWRSGLGLWGTLALASWIHPALGLQVGGVLGLATSLLLFSRSGMGSFGESGARLGAIGLGCVPALVYLAGNGQVLTAGLDAETFRLLAVEIQGPQHLAPWVWRWDQWGAAVCYLAIGLSQVLRTWHDSANCANVAFKRLVLLLAVLVCVLLASWVGVVWWGDLRLTLFQPFRLATVARGVCLLIVAPGLAEMWRAGGLWGRMRVLLLVLGLVGDQAWLAAVLAELAARAWEGVSQRVAVGAWVLVLAFGLGHLQYHDPARSIEVVGPGLAVGLVALRVAHRLDLGWNRRRRGLVLGACWVMPAMALLAGIQGLRTGEVPAWGKSFVARCRFVEVATDDVERLGAWARVHLPGDAVLIGPPGPKTLRLWSRRAVVFNRSASPYHARALRDWAERFRRHVRFEGTWAEFARAYQTRRQELESRYYDQSLEAIVDLARRSGADHVVTLREDLIRERGVVFSEGGANSQLVVLRAAGRYALYYLR